MARVPTDRCGQCVSCRGEEGIRHYCPFECHRGVTRDRTFVEYMNTSSFRKVIPRELVVHQTDS